MIRKVEALLEQKVRPGLKSHGGNIELIDIDNNKVFVKLTGGCQGCSASKATVKDGVERILKSEFPMITEVIDLTDHTQGEKPYM